MSAGIMRQGPFRTTRLAIAFLAAAALLPDLGCGMKPGGMGGASGDAIERKAEKGPVTMVVRVTPKEPKLSDLVEMDVTVDSREGVEVKPPAFGQAVGDFLIRDYTERPPEPGEAHRRHFHYQLEPTHAGKHLIRAISVEFTDNRDKSERRGAATLIESEPLEVNVTSEWGDETPDLAKLEPMVPPQQVSQARTAWWMVGAALALLAAFGLILASRRRKRKPVEPKRRSPEEIAHEALAQLLAEDLPGQGLVKEFYLRLTGIVRRYVEDTTGIHAPEQTTEEFLRDMRSRNAFPPERSARLAEFLEAADLVKYAGQQPGGDQIEQAISRAQEFVNLTPLQTGEILATD